MGTNHRRLRLAVIALSVCTASLVASQREQSKPAEPGPTVFLSRAFGVAPAEVRAVIRVARNDDNRFLRVTLDSGDYFRSSVITLEGSRAAVQHPLSWKGLPAGDYELQIEVVGSQGVRQTASRTFYIVG